MNSNIYEKITNRMVDLLEKGNIPWRKPWSTVASLPRNYATEREYRGVNAFILACSGFDNPNFMTFHQAMAHGGRVKKGSVGLPVVYWSGLSAPDQKNQDGASEATTEQEHVRPVLRYYTVFNAEQIEGIDFPKLASVPGVKRADIQSAEEIFAGWKDGPRVQHGRHQAYYDIAKDTIFMPDKDAFESMETYCSVRFHEMGHATGAKSRLNRPMGGRYGSKEYAREELVAEMTAAFLCASCRIDNQVIENQAAYIEGWMKALKDDKTLFIRAAGLAQKASNLIVGLQPSREIEVADLDGLKKAKHESIGKHIAPAEAFRSIGEVEV